MSRWMALGAAALLLAACATAPEMPPGFLMQPSAARDLLAQCSRERRDPGQSAFTPTAAEVRAMQAALPAAIAADPRAEGPRPDDATIDWIGQYVGIVRGGRRFIYGNFWPVYPVPTGPDLRIQAMIVCDGGPRFWGAEYDIEAGRIIHLGYNGSLK